LVVAGHYNQSTSASEPRRKNIEESFDFRAAHHAGQLRSLAKNLYSSKFSSFGVPNARWYTAIA